MGCFRSPVPCGSLLKKLHSIWLQQVTVTPTPDFSQFWTFHFDDKILGSDLRAGTPPSQEGNPKSLATIKLEQPRVSIKPKDGTIISYGVLSLPSTQYPAHYDSPLKVPVTMTIKPSDWSLLPPRVTAKGFATPVSGYRANFTIHLSYNRNNLSNALKGNKEALYPALDISAGMQLVLPLLSRVPILNMKTSMNMHFPTTKEMARPLLGMRDRPLPGKLAKLPGSYSMRGWVPVPKGAIFDVPVPGWGYSRSSYSEKGGYTFSAAVLPTFSPSAISAGGKSLNEKFPVYGYLEWFGVKRVGDGLDVGLRVTLSPSTLDLVKKGSKQGEGATDDFVRDGARELQSKPWLPPSRDNVTPEESKTLINVQLEGRFNAL